VHIREDIQQDIFYTFKNRELLERALTHKSYSNENIVFAHNERMEFLGDAVLNLIVSEYLMKTCPDSTEGDLTRLRSVIVSESTLAEVGRRIGLGKYLLLGKGEELTGGRTKRSLLANSIEALIAAIYLDSGADAAELFIIHFFGEILKKTCDCRITRDYKTELQELCQERHKHLPEYQIVSETGPDHQKQFEVELSIRNIIYGRGEGGSKKEAEQCAANAALKKLSENETSR